MTKDLMEKRLKEREKLAKDFQACMDQFAKIYKRLISEDLETYKMLSKPDCLYNDSPISVFQVNHSTKLYLMKRGLSFLYSNFNIDQGEIKDFYVQLAEASGWVLRFANEKEKPATGISAILGLKKNQEPEALPKPIKQQNKNLEDLLE